jgi:tRNA pseudouridine65 synthase
MSGKAESFLHPRVREVFRDETLLVLDKPPGVLSHPNPPEEESRGALVRAPYDFEREAYWVTVEGRKRPLHLIHRLDQETSGLILLTFDPNAAAALREAFFERRMRKEYRALVLGIPRPPAGIWRDELSKRSGEGKLRVMVVPGGRPNAETRYQTMRVFPRAGAALIHLEPETGRTHQLRVQTASRGLPIAGDERYGDFEANRRLAKGIGLRRMFLHAYRLELRHPRTSHRLVFTAELTRPLSEPLERLQGVAEAVRSPEARAKARRRRRRR